MTFTTIPEKVDAIQWTGANISDVNEFIDNFADTQNIMSIDYGSVVILTSQGKVTTKYDDWIVRYADGEVFVFSDEDFSKKFASIEQFKPTLKGWQYFE